MTEPARIERPKLRPVQHSLVQEDGQDLLVLRDPTGYVEDAIALSAHAAILLQHFDGTMTIEEIVGELLRSFEVAVEPTLISDLAQRLDELGFMDTARFEAIRAARNVEFRSQPARPAAFAGTSYSGDPAELSAMLDGLFREVAGEERAKPQVPPDGIIAPHIDMRVAEMAYAHAYKCFRQGRRRPDLFVVFGTAHSLISEPFVATRVPYATPLGSVPVDGSFVDAMAARYDGDLFCDEAAHGGEHSIEFQAVLLRYLFGDETPPMVPILCGTLEGEERGTVDPDRGGKAERLLRAIREVAIERGVRVCAIAGADLAHLGPRFDDPEPMDAPSLELLEAEDRVTLSHVERGDAQTFFRSVSHDGNRRRICGLTPIYMTLRWTGNARGVLHDYHQWLEEGSVVSFAAVTIGEA